MGKVFLSVFIMCFGVSSLCAAERIVLKMYRYKDEQGVTVIRDSVPPHIVSKGYDVIGSDGLLIERVPRALTKEEIEAIEGSASARDAQRRKTEAQEAADRKLLTMFSSPRDAERARERKIEALDVLISVHRGNIIRLRAEYDIFQKQAADIERSGQAVPDHLIEKMDRTDRQIVKLEENIKEKEAEKLVVRASYEKDIERLKELKGL